MKTHSVSIFTDGSSRGNPGPGGWGAIVATTERVIELGGREDRTTNNRMELQAVIEALIKIKSYEADVTIHTDSSYVTQGITKWVKGWIKNGWITKTKEEVLNRDLWEILTALLDERSRMGEVEWKQISGHAGVPGNERTDEIATLYADKEDPRLFDGPRKHYEINLEETHNREKKIVKDTKKSRSKAKAYSYISKVEGKIETHTTWEECEKRVKGVSAAKYKKALSQEEEKEIIAEWS